MEMMMLVDPTHLRDAAQAQSEVGDFVSGMNSAQSVASSGAHVAGLQSESACQFLGDLFDKASTEVHTALTDHSTKLAAAADHYHRMDEEFGRRLRAFGS